MATKARVRVRGMGKVRTTALVALATTGGAGTHRHGRLSTIPGLMPSRCGQGCTLLSSRCIHRSTPCSLHQYTMTPRWPCLLTPASAPTTPTAGQDLYLVTLDGHVGSTNIGQLLQYYGLDSLGGH
jgi:hypothetical protein